MNLAISPGGMIRTVEVPASKSYANRALILAALRPGDFLLRSMPAATDVTNLIKALSKIGIGLQSTKEGLLVSGSFPSCEKGEMTIEVGEGGTTARFLAVLLLKGKMRYQLKLGQRLKERPWQEFIDLALSHGAFAELLDDTLTIQGPLTKKNTIIVDCTRTTQFLSAFQIVFSDEHEVKEKNLSSSQSYVAMTKEMIRDFKSLNEYSIPRDWSSASYPLAFAALNEGAEFPSLSFDPYQSDAKFFDVLKSHGGLHQNSEGIIVKPVEKDFSLHIDVSDCLDFVPTLAFFLSHINGEHTLCGVSNLVHKESDRLRECQSLMSLFERESTRVGDTLVIKGHRKKILEKRDISLPDDHRMVMAATLFLRHHGGGTVFPAEAVEKSYPNFFELFPASS